MIQYQLKIHVYLLHVDRTHNVKLKDSHHLVLVYLISLDHPLTADLSV